MLGGNALIATMSSSGVLAMETLFSAVFNA